jgi:hypothetical protein
MGADPIAGRRAEASARRLWRVTVVGLLALLGAATTAGWYAEGSDGAASAALGVGLTSVLFAGGLLGLRRAAGPKASFLPVVTAGGLRLVLYAAALALVTRAEWLHGPSLALATAASIAVMLAIELVAVAREPVAELEPRARAMGEGQAGTTD